MINFLKFSQIGRCTDVLLKNRYDKYKTYMLNSSVIEQTVKLFDIGTNRINEFIKNNPTHHDFANTVKGIFIKNDELHRSLLIELCEFNANFIEMEIEKSQLELNPIEMEVMKTLKRFPDKITAKCSINQKNDDFDLRFITVDDTLQKGLKNLDFVPKHLLDNINYIVASTERVMDQAISAFTKIPNDTQTAIDDLKKCSGKLKTVFIEYLQIRKTNAAESPAAIKLLKQFEDLLKPEISSNQIEALKKFRANVDETLEDAEMILGQCQLWLTNMIAFEPTYVFSDANKLQQTLINKINAFNAFKEKIFDSSKSRIWLQKFIDLLTLCKDLIAKVNIRALNLSLDTIPQMYSLLKNDPVPQHKAVCTEFMKLLNDYKALYSFTTLITDERIRNFIEYDFEGQFLNRWEQKIKGMKDNLQLDNLLTNAVKTFKNEEKKTDSMATTLLNDFKFSVPISNGIRETFFPIIGFYEIQSCPDDPVVEPAVLEKIKETFIDYLNDAMDVTDSQWKIQMNKHANDVKASIKNCFDQLNGHDLINKVNEILKNAP